MTQRWTLQGPARGLAVIAMGAWMAGCAGGLGGTGPSRGDAADAASAARGEVLAQRACASCHGMGLTGASSWLTAQPFRDMTFDYNAISYERRMAQLHQGHVSMPPAEISLADVRDIGAYVRSLKQAARR